MTKKETLCFKVDSEWLCNFVRTRVFDEGLSFEEGLNILRISFNGITDEIAKDILKGKKKIVGINGGTLEEDNQEERFLKWCYNGHCEYLEGNEREGLPSWVIKEDGTFNHYDGAQSFYLRDAKYVPLKKGVFTKFGLISPEGNFYSCEEASHADAAHKLCNQFGYGISKIHTMRNQDEAKDCLFERGWVFVNSVGSAHRGNYFYSKWGDSITDMPQAIMDTAFDYIEYRAVISN